MLDTCHEHVDQFQTIVDSYETLVKDLNHDFSVLKNEQQDIKLQLSAVLSENSDLSKSLQSALSHTETHIPIIENDELIINLKKQINELITEKDYISKLWQEGVKTIDRLEDELKVYQAGHEGFVPKKEFKKLKTFYEEKVANLETTLMKTERQLKEVAEQGVVKQKETDQSIVNHASALKIVKNLEVEILKLQQRLHDASNERVHAERLLQDKEAVIHSLKKSNVDCLLRVTEAMDIVEEAISEKEAALLREKSFKEENDKLLQQIEQFSKESMEKVALEANALKAEFNDKQQQLLEDLANANKETHAKYQEIEDLRNKIESLENELIRLHQGHCRNDEGDINKLLVLEKNLESTFQKLLVSEKSNIQLTADKNILKNDLEQMADLYERTLKGKDIEIATLNNKIQRLEREITESNDQVAKISDRMNKLNEEIAKTEQQLRDQKENVIKCLQTNQEEKLARITKQFNDNIKELQEQIELKNDIHQRWKKEAAFVIQNLEQMVGKLKMDCESLKKHNKSCKEKYRKSEDRLKQYKTFLELINKDVAKINNITGLHITPS